MKIDRRTLPGARRGSLARHVARLAPLVLLTLLLLPAAPGAAAASPTVPESQVAEAIEFRRSLGFRADRDFVIAAEASKSFSHRYGYGLTDSEVTELERRLEIQDQSDRSSTHWTLSPLSVATTSTRQQGR